MSLNNKLNESFDALDSYIAEDERKPLDREKYFQLTDLIDEIVDGCGNDKEQAIDFLNDIASQCKKLADRIAKENSDLNEDADEDIMMNLMNKVKSVIESEPGIEKVGKVDYAPYAANGEYFIPFAIGSEEYYIALGSQEVED